jgi:integrase
MATIRQRGKRWQAIVKRKGYPTQAKSFALKADALKWARMHERKQDTGEWLDRTEANQTTFSELCERYKLKVSKGKRGADIEAYRLAALQRSALAPFAVSAITGRVIAQWRDKRLESVSGSSVAREMELLSHIFAVAIREWGFGLSQNPVSFVRKPKRADARDRTLSDDERAALLSACDQCRNIWIRPVVVFALETAARRGEILSLTWGAIDLNKRTAKVSGKTGRRVIPLSPVAVNLLKCLARNLDRQSPVFPVTVDALKHAFVRAVNRAGLYNFTFHDLRHDALTRLARLGLSVLELRAISGHTTANMLQRYVKIEATELAKKLANSA